MLQSVGQEIRDKISGAYEVLLTRRNATGGGPHGDHAKQKASEDIPSKDLVIYCSESSLFSYYWLLEFSIKK